MYRKLELDETTFQRSNAALAKALQGGQQPTREELRGGRRYFLSRRPASVQDFAKWSGLTITGARRGLEAVKAQLDHEVVDSQTYWFAGSVPAAQDVSPTAETETNLFTQLTQAEEQAVVAAAERYGQFLGLPVIRTSN
jgi:hypothetical protein